MKPIHQSNRGVALVITLAILGIVTLFVVGFAISMRTEQIASRTFREGGLARHLAAAAVDEAILLIRTNTPVITANRTYVTQPGRIVSDSSLLELLYSTNASGGVVDLNLDETIIPSNSFYSAANRRRVEVNWITVGTNGGPATASNPIIGRYAYWVDDEACKINVNQARMRSTFFGTGPADIDLTVLPGIGGALASNSFAYATNGALFSREQWKSVSGIGAATYRQNEFYITAFGEDSNLTPWGLARFNLNSATNVWKTEIDLGATNTLTHRGLTNWFGFGNTFANKYGTNVLRQIMANMADFTEAGLGNNLPSTGAQGIGTGPGQLDNGLAGTYGIPRDYLGLRAHPFINEIGVQATYWRPSGGNEIQCKLWFLVEMVNPYPFPLGNGGQIRIHMDKLVYRVADSGGAWNYMCGYESGWVQNPTCVALNPPYASPQETIFNIPHNIAAHSMTVFPIAVWSGNPETAPSAIIDQVYVRVNKIRYLQVANNELTIRDWAQIGDFDLRLVGGNHFTFLSPNISFIAGGVQPPFNNNLTQGLAKNDPRVRRFVTWTPPGTGTQLPWTPVGYDVGIPATIPTSRGAENTGVVTFTGPVGNTAPFTSIPRDPVPTEPSALSVTNHPSFFIKGYAAGAVDIMVDNPSATFVGSWPTSSSECFIGANRVYNLFGQPPGASARFTPTLPSSGSYEVLIYYFAAGDRASNTPIDINHAAGTTTITKNQQVDGCQWVSLGTYNFNAGTSGNVTFRNDGVNGHVAADAVRFVAAGSFTAASYESPVELGRIHTGLQWRTLMMQPRPSTEAAADLIPDWAMLDIFGVTAGIARQPRININSAVTNLYTGNANWVPRTNVISSLLTAITPGNHLGQTTDQGRIATNIHNQVWATGNTGNGWGAKRLSPFRFIPGMYSWIGELCEVDLISTNIGPSSAVTNDWVREARLATFLNLVTVRSSHFTVHGLGQAIQVTPAGNTNIIGQARVQAVVERFDSADGQFGSGADTNAYRVVYHRYMTD